MNLKYETGSPQRVASALKKKSNAAKWLATTNPAEAGQIIINVDVDRTSVTTVKTENGTQTRVGTRRKGSVTSAIPQNYVSSLKQISPRHKLKRRKAKLMDWNKFHRLNVIYSYIDDLERDFPSICTVTCIGKSVEGRDIKMLKISNSNATNTPVWLDGTIHPREWISAAVVTFIAENLVKNFHKLSKSVVNKDWHIVPVLNPDGYEYTHTHDRMWRKNKACHEGECVGVDLNRNFSYGWGHNGEEGSSNTEDSVFYRGPAPFSEPESAAVRDTILGSVSPFKAFLSFHSYFEMIIFPWGYKKDPCPNYLNLMEAGMQMARAIHQTTGMTYKVGSTKDLTYYACGTSTDWAYSVAKIPYSFMIELRSRKYKFRLPKDQIKDNCLEVWNAVKTLMAFIDEKDEAHVK